MDIFAKVRGGSLWFTAQPHCAGSLTKVALQAASRKEFRDRIVFAVSKRRAQRQGRYQEELGSHRNDSFSGAAQQVIQ
jgi:hypothetical protein